MVLRIPLGYVMDAEKISTLKTVCAAGGAREGFNGESLDLLVIAYASSLLAQHRAYTPTEKGRSVCKELVEKELA